MLYEIYFSFAPNIHSNWAFVQMFFETFLLYLEYYILHHSKQYPQQQTSYPPLSPISNISSPPISPSQKRNLTPLK